MKFCLILFAFVISYVFANNAKRDAMLYDFPSYSITGYANCYKAISNEMEQLQLQDFLYHFGTKVVYKLYKFKLFVLKIEFDVVNKGRYLSAEREVLNYLAEKSDGVTRAHRFYKRCVPRLCDIYERIELTYGVYEPATTGSGVGHIIAGMTHTFRQIGELYRDNKIGVYAVGKIMENTIRAIQHVHTFNVVNYNIGEDTIGVNINTNDVTLMDHTLSMYSERNHLTNQYSFIPLAVNKYNLPISFDLGAPPVFTPHGLYMGPRVRECDWRQLVMTLHSVFGEIPWRTWIISHMIQTELVHDGISEMWRLCNIYMKNGSFTKLHIYLRKYLNTTLVKVIKAVSDNVDSMNAERMKVIVREVLKNILKKRQKQVKQCTKTSLKLWSV